MQQELKALEGLHSRLLDKLRFNHKGQSRSIKAQALADYFSVSEREVRDIISQLRRQRIPICSDAHGFWYPLSREDAASSIAWIVSRFQPLREAYNGFLGGLDDEFGDPTLFDNQEVAI